MILGSLMTGIPILHHIINPNILELDIYLDEAADVDAEAIYSII